MLKRLTFILTLITTLCLTGTAYAHASLLRSTPSAGETIDTAPPEMVLEFTEDLDPAYTRVQLLDSNNQVINAGPGQLDSASPRIWHIALGNLPQGSYIVTWRARSAADGHVTEGIVPFGVGVPSSVPLIPPANAPDPLTPPVPPFDAASRWLNLLAALLAFGGIFFGVFVLRAGSDSLAPVLRKLSVIGGSIFIATHIFFLLVQASQAAGVSLLQAIGSPMLLMLTSYTGRIVIARVVLALIAIELAQHLPMRRWWVALIPASAAILGFSLVAHGAAQPQGAAVAVAVDFLHVAATVVWLGGLVPLLIAINASRKSPETSLPLATLIPRFSVVALVCVGVLSLSGLYSYFIHVNQLDLVAATTYGRALAVKTALFAGLVVLGAINLFIFTPRLRTHGGEMAKAFARTVRTELMIGAAVLLAVGAMTSVAPSLTAVEARDLAMKDIAQESVVIDGVGIKLYVAPAQVGSNEFVVDVNETRPGAEAVPAEVLIRLSQVGKEDSELQIALESTDGLRYARQGSYITVAGDWNIEIIVRRTGFNDARVKFQLPFDGQAHQH